MTAQIEISSGDGVTVIVGLSRVFVHAASDGTMELYIGDADSEMEESRLIVRDGIPDARLEKPFEEPSPSTAHPT